MQNTIAGTARREMQQVFKELRQVLSDRQLIFWKGVLRVPTIELVREIYWDRVRQILNTPGAVQPVDPATPIAVQCKDCKRVHMVARDVKTFVCCSSEEQWVVKSRNVDLIP